MVKIVGSRALQTDRGMVVDANAFSTGGIALGFEASDLGPMSVRLRFTARDARALAAALTELADLAVAAEEAAMRANLALLAAAVGAREIV